VRYPIGVLLFLAAIVWPPAVMAQESASVPSSVHARAAEGAETTLDLDNARLIVPAGAVASGP
jgi:hypothetical protein